MTKCKACHTNERTWAWQPFGPDESSNCFTTLGSHYRGFPVIDVCGTCKDKVIAGDPGIIFTYKKIGYYSLDGKVKETPF